MGILLQIGPNQIKVLREPHMKHNVTQLEEKNEPVNFVLGNHLIELEPGDYQVEEASYYTRYPARSPSIFTG